MVQNMEVDLTQAQMQLLERAAQQQGITVEQFLQQATQQYLEQRLGKPAGSIQGKTFFLRPKPICH